MMVATAFGLRTASAADAPQILKDGVVIPVGDNFLKLEVCSDSIIHVAWSPNAAFFARKSLDAGVRRDTKTDWTFKTDNGQGVLTTDKLRVNVDLSSGAVSFLNAAGQPILAEAADGHTMTKAFVQGDRTYHVRQQWQANDDEALFGLGQQQLGLMNIKGYDLDLWQHNGTVAIPVLVSSRGYGILWDNTSYTRFGDLRQAVPIPAEQLMGTDGKAGGLTGSYYAGENFERLVGTRVDPEINIAIPSDATDANHQIFPALPSRGDVSVRWEGEVVPDETGDYQLEAFFNNGLKLWVDGKLVISHWRQGWLPWWSVARVSFEAGRHYHLKLEWTKEQGMETAQLFWKTPSHETNTSLWSEVGEGIDYYFMYGPDLDKVIAGYRQITGTAPMPPEWIFGFWQSRQRYKTQQESLGVVEGYRARHVPFDNIVQDWFYWKEDQWGSHEFDPTRFPNPDAWIRDIHNDHAHLTISVWPKFYAGTTNFEIMRAHHFLYEENLAEDIIDWVGHPDTFYDAFNPDARKLFWSQINDKLFSKNVDGWWMDASEPDMLPTPTLDGQRTHLHPTAMGTGARMLNAYPLENSESIYDGQRGVKPDQRVFILTRSGFAGEQRYGATVWSGDTSATWTAMRLQITAGLGFCLSGMPYWAMDSGGFSVPSWFSSGDDFEEWCEMNTRWFEFCTFVPLLRVHGESPNREMWEFGGDSSPTYAAQVKFDRLRYRLFPYIYSLAGNVTQDGGTMMRALVMDFRSDTNVFKIGDEFMFGPSFLVNPVTAYQVRSRPVYLPQTPGGWYDFWTGQSFAAGQTIDAPAPYDAIPTYVRAGSIVPFGPEIQYIGEKAADPLTVYIYTGADGDFTLYEDDGSTYKYEKGAFAQIPLHWNDATRTLTIGKRKGSFEGMLKDRTIQFVLVSKDAPVGFSFNPSASHAIKYSGEDVQVSFN
jgi:alpha-D-xyloside xylohydrolase